MKLLNGGVNGFRKILALLIFAALVPAISTDAFAKKKGPYDLKFGMVALGPNNEAVVFSETRHVEKYTDPSHLHGFTVTRRDGGQFLAYYKVRFPEPLKKISDGMRKYFTITENGRAFQSPEGFHRGRYAEHFRFDESDPVGMYEMEIYIDGELYKKIEYEVISMESEELPF